MANRTIFFVLWLAFTMGASAQEAIRVVAEPLVGIKQNVTAKAPAQVISSNEAAIAAEVDAVVASVNVEVSDTVKKGTVLVELDSRDLELQLAQAEANLAAQQARIQRGEVRLKRARELAKSQFVSEDELLERETDLEVLLADRRVVQVSVASAKRELNKTRVLAPFDGVILTRDAQVGAFANRSTPLLTLVEIGRPRLLAQISNGDVESVRRGFNLAFQNESGHWPVQLKEIAQVVNNRTRVQSARFDFIGEQPLAGSTGYLVWDRPENVVSTTMIVRRDNRLGVFTLENGKAVFHHLPGAQEGRPAAVNLPDDTLIIVRGQQRVQDGDAAVNAR